MCLLWWINSLILLQNKKISMNAFISIWQNSWKYELLIKKLVNIANLAISECLQYNKIQRKHMPLTICTQISAQVCAQLDLGDGTFQTVTTLGLRLGGECYFWSTSICYSATYLHVHSATNSLNCTTILLFFCYYSAISKPFLGLKFQIFKIQM